MCSETSKYNHPGPFVKLHLFSFTVVVILTVLKRYVDPETGAWIHAALRAQFELGLILSLPSSGLLCKHRYAHYVPRWLLTGSLRVAER